MASFYVIAAAAAIADAFSANARANRLFAGGADRHNFQRIRARARARAVWRTLAGAHLHAHSRYRKRPQR